MVDRVKGETDEGRASERYRPVVTDFGLARDLSVKGQLTESGAVLGTPAYMSPEQASGETRHLDQRTDVYSLGATLYELVVGEPPFADTSRVALLSKVMDVTPVPPRARVPAIPDELNTIICKCLNNEADQRYATAQELAEDLRRLQRAQRIVGRKLTLGYRLRYWARRNGAPAALTLGLVVSLLCLGGHFIFTRIAVHRHEVATRRQVELSRRLGQDLKDLEWIIRAGTMLPLHDLGYEQGLARERMKRVQQSLRAYGPDSEGLAAYVLGRGHLALWEYGEALQYLKQAEALGVVEPELDLALGMTLGQLLQRELERVNQSGDRQFIEKRRQALEREYVQPALQYLQRGKRGELGTSVYVEGLIAWHQQNYQEALTKAHAALRETPWLYEARKLAGDVYLAQAHRARGQGRPQELRQAFERAEQEYQSGVEVGRSDAELYERLAEVALRQMELSNLQGLSPEAKLQQVLQHCDKVLAVMPRRAQAWIKKSFAYMRMGHFLIAHAHNLGDVATRHREAAERALELDPSDVYALESLASVYNSQVREEFVELQRRKDYIDKAIELLTRATQRNQNFPLGLNELGMSYRLAGITARMQGLDPIESFRRSIACLETARKLDPDYARPLQSTVHTYVNWAAELREHGTDPSGIFELGTQAGRRCQTANPKNVMCYHPTAALLNQMAGYQLDAGLDAAPVLAEFDRLVSEQELRFPQERDGRGNRIALYLLRARAALTQDQDADALLAETAALVRACVQANPRDYHCVESQARIGLLQAESWRRRRQLAPALQALRAALPAAEAVTRYTPLELPSHCVLAELHLRIAEAQNLAGQPAQDELEQGLLAARRGLSINASYPETLAVQGALLAVRARLARSPEERKLLREQSSSALARACQLNPTLRRRYAAYL